MFLIKDCQVLFCHFVKMLLKTDTILKNIISVYTVELFGQNSRKNFIKAGL